MDHVLAAEQSTEDLGLIAREGIEGFWGPFWSDLLTRRDAIQSADRASSVTCWGSRMPARFSTHDRHTARTLSAAISAAARFPADDDGSWPFHRNMPV